MSEILEQLFLVILARKFILSVLIISQETKMKLLELEKQVVKSIIGQQKTKLLHMTKIKLKNTNK